MGWLKGRPQPIDRAGPGGQKVRRTRNESVKSYWEVLYAVRSRCRELGVLAAGVAFGAGPLAVVRPSISEFDGGAPDPPSFQYPPGQTLFFTCRIANFTKSSDDKFHLAYSVQAFDPKDVPLDKIYKNEVIDEAGPQDRDGCPRLSPKSSSRRWWPRAFTKSWSRWKTCWPIPAPHAEVPFQVRGHALAPSDKVAIQNFRFFRPGENDPQPVERTGL